MQQIVKNGEEKEKTEEQHVGIKLLGSPTAYGLSNEVPERTVREWRQTRRASIEGRAVHPLRRTPKQSASSVQLYAGVSELTQEKHISSA
jgi:hypothetical protein